MKMRPKRVPLTILALVMACTTATAQEGKTLRLSLAEAEQFAVEHNKTMRNAELDVKKAELEHWKTLSTMLPQVKAGFDYQNMLGYTMNMGGFSIPLNPNGTFSLTASMALTGAQIVGTTLQRISQEMSDITREQTEQTTRANVKNVYVSILVMERTVELLDSSMSNLSRLAATAQNAVDAGASEQVDADKLQVQVATMQNSITSTRRQLELLRNTLLLQLGADVADTVKLTTTLEQVLDLDAAARLLAENFDIHRNYDYQLLQQSEKLAKRNVTMAYMDFTPTLSAYYQYSSKTYFGAEEGMNMTPPNMVGASVSVPIFSSGTRTANVKSAKISYQEAVNSKQQAEDGLKVQYNQLRYDLASALESYDIQRRTLELSRKVFGNVTEKYKYGRASSLEVTTASSDIITAQSNYIQAVMSVVSAQIEIENLMNIGK